jgi:hypothetical protein
LKDYGFAYVALIFIETVYDGQQVVDQLIQPLDRYTKSAHNSGSAMEEATFTFTPSLLLGDPKLRGAGAWKPVGVKELQPADLVKPDFKLCYQLDRIQPGEDLSELTWYLVKDFDPGQSKEIDYVLVKHLGFFAELNYWLVSAKLTLEWMRKHGREVRDYFSDDDFNTVPGLGLVYAHVLSVDAR